MNQSEHFRKIQAYYSESAQAYQNWGRDEEREGIYALHCGYERPGETKTHYESVKALTREIIRFANLKDGGTILDSGCGTGSVAFEIKSQFPSSKVAAINIAINQLEQAQQFQKQLLGSTEVILSQQNFGGTAFASESFDSVIFSESIAHALNKKDVIEETRRILKFGGTITIADVFQLRDPKNEDEFRMLEDATRGWFIPDFQSLSTFLEELTTSGFILEEINDDTNFVLPSVARMRMNTERRLASGSVASPIIELSRKAVIASHETLGNGLVGYFLIRGRKK